MTPAGSTKYTSDLPVKLTEHMKAGKSVRQFCRDHDISKSAFYEWIKIHPPLMDAFTHGRENQQAAWEDMALSNMTNHKFNTNLFKFMSNVMFGWTEAKVVEQTTTVKFDESNVAELEEAKKAHIKEI